MKGLRHFALACSLLALSPTSAAEPSLPPWTESERSGVETDDWLAGSLLLTQESLPDEANDEPVPAMDLPLPSAEEIAEPATPTTEIPEKFWSDYDEARPQSFLVDPQGILSPVDSRERLGFLNYHAGDSSIDLFVYMFAADQEIPGELRDEEWAERFFSVGRPAALVYYYMGAPQRSVLYLSPSLMDIVSPAEQRRALESSIMQAVEKIEPAAQIEAFLVQMSIRIYWMERMLSGNPDATEETAAPAPTAATPAKKPDTISRKFAPLIQSATPFILPASLLLTALVLAITLVAWMKRRAHYEFPNFKVEPRLGGNHAAGVGAVISFASAALPPASQRDQVSDDLRRA